MSGLGVSTYLWASPFGDEHLDLFRHARDLGCDVLEICVEDPCGVRKFGRTSQNIRFAGKTEFTHPTGHGVAMVTAPLDLQDLLSELDRSS